MAYLYQTFKKDGTPHKRWRFQYRDWRGEKKKATGYASKVETEKLALRVQAEQEEIRNGFRPRPKASDEEWSFSELKAEYLDWGCAQGGLRGRPWSPEHARKKTAQLDWWEDELGLDYVSDLIGCLPEVERLVRELLESRSGKTVQNYVETIASFCDWLVTREFLEVDPLRKLAPINTTPETRRRAMTLEEIRLLLSVAPPERRLLYEVAFTTGLRANELRQLKVSDLEPELGGVALSAEWTKNRKAGFQPLPVSVLGRLQESSKQKTPDSALLYVPSHPARELDKDLEAAGIKKTIDGVGKIDFHACRTAYATLVIESGASVKETQHLLRHSSPRLMDVYARTRGDRLGEVAEQVGERLFKTGQEGETDDQVGAPTEPPQGCDPPGGSAVSHDGGECSEEREFASTGVRFPPPPPYLPIEPLSARERAGLSLLVIGRRYRSNGNGFRHRRLRRPSFISGRGGPNSGVKIAQMLSSSLLSQDGGYLVPRWGDVEWQGFMTSVIREGSIPDWSSGRGWGRTWGGPSPRAPGGIQVAPSSSHYRVDYCCVADAGSPPLQGSL